VKHDLKSALTRTTVSLG